MIVSIQKREFKTKNRTFFQTLDMKTTAQQKKRTRILALHLIFHHFSQFNSCFKCCFVA